MEDIDEMERTDLVQALIILSGFARAHGWPQELPDEEQIDALRQKLQASGPVANLFAFDYFGRA